LLLYKTKANFLKPIKSCNFRLALESRHIIHTQSLINTYSKTYLICLKFHKIFINTPNVTLDFNLCFSLLNLAKSHTLYKKNLLDLFFKISTSLRTDVNLNVSIFSTKNFNNKLLLLL
jgi:hypothetical protein